MSLSRAVLEKFAELEGCARIVYGTATGDNIVPIGDSTSTAATSALIPVKSGDYCAVMETSDGDRLILGPVHGHEITKWTSAGEVEVAGNLDCGGNVVFNVNEVQALAGSETDPSYTTTGDTNTGTFSPGADLWAVTTGGIERLRVNDNGRLQIFTTTSEALAIQSTVSDLYGPYMSFLNNLGQRTAYIGNPAQAHFYINNDVHGGDIIFLTQDAGGTLFENKIHENGKIESDPTRANQTSLAPNMYVHTNGFIYYTTHANSSMRFKEDPEDLSPELALQIMRDIQAIYYRSNQEHVNPDWRFIGFSAEQVAPIAPWLVEWMPPEDCTCDVLVGPITEGSSRKAQIHMHEHHCTFIPNGVDYARFTVVQNLALQCLDAQAQFAEVERDELRAELATERKARQAIEARLAAAGL